MKREGWNGANIVVYDRCGKEKLLESFKSYSKVDIKFGD